MKVIDSDELNFLITGNDPDYFTDIIKEIQLKNKIKFNIKVICDKSTKVSDYYQSFYDLINDAFYCNTFILNYKTKESVIKFFYGFNSDYKKTYIRYISYPFFLINETIIKKSELVNEIKTINKEKPEMYHINSKDILSYSDKESLTKKLVHIINYYTENSILEEKIDEEKTLNIMLCGIKGVGKTTLINKLLFENRGLTKENNYTSKLSKYNHKLYPICFYDMPGFGQNEDTIMTETKSYISQFNKHYENIKEKIHIILYVFNCSSSRLLQEKEVELIENFLTYRIPIFFIGNKSISIEEKTFKRSLIQALKKTSINHTTEYLESHIFCINNTNKSISLLLEKIVEELNLSKISHDNLIKIFEDNNYINEAVKELSELGDEDDLEDANKITIEGNQEIERKIMEEMKKSIFFNDLSYSINNAQIKIKEITDQIKKNSKAHYPFQTITKDIENLSKQIEAEYKKLISEEDLKDIEKEIARFNPINNNSLLDLGFEVVDGAGAISTIVIPLLIFTSLNSLFSIIPSVLIPTMIGSIFYKKKINAKKIDDFSFRINKRYIKQIVLLNHISIKIKAEKYNKVIQQFKSYIKHFQKECDIDIDLIPKSDVEEISFPIG